jgi:hypothetical protein
MQRHRVVRQHLRTPNLGPPAVRVRLEALHKKQRPARSTQRTRIAGSTQGAATAGYAGAAAGAGTAGLPLTSGLPGVAEVTRDAGDVARPGARDCRVCRSRRGRRNCRGCRLRRGYPGLLRSPGMPGMSRGRGPPLPGMPEPPRAPELPGLPLASGRPGLLRFRQGVYPPRATRGAECLFRAPLTRLATSQPAVRRCRRGPERHAGGCGASRHCG